MSPQKHESHINTFLARDEAAEARLAEAHEALRAYDVAFGEWAKLVEMTLSREACEQWQSIARAALSGEPS